MGEIAAVILAAGKGTRMKSNIPKVLHKANGQPLVEHVLEAISKAGVTKVVLVVGHGAQEVQEYLGDRVQYVLQNEQLGTGHAVMQAEPLLKHHQGPLLVVCGDTPLISSDTYQSLIHKHSQEGTQATILSAKMDDPTGYGRIVRDSQGRVQAIVEQKDASAEQKLIKEVNTGTYCFEGQALFRALHTVQPNNAQGEYYLTDVVEILKHEGLKIDAEVADDTEETLGVNDRVQLAVADKFLRLRKNRQLMLEGVTITDPERTYIQEQVSVGRDTIIYPDVYLEGKVSIGENCIIGKGSRVVNSTLADGVKVEDSIILESTVASECTIGPFAYLRPGTELASKVKIGDFVEVKKSKLGQGSKIPHLSYVGDAEIGEYVNIGAGTITCNYDGIHKHKTVIEDKAFIGSNTNLVAPVVVGQGALVAAGSTITKDVPEQALGVGRSKQTNIEDWAKRNG